MYVQYNMYMIYTIAEFKKNTRKILNEALISPVIIKRYSDRFVLKAHKQTKDSQSIAVDKDVEAQI